VFLADPLTEPTRLWFAGYQGYAEWRSLPTGYRLMILELGGWAYSYPLAMLTPADVTVAVDVRFAASDALGTAGLACRGVAEAGYGFDISPDGRYWIYRIDDISREPATLAGPTSHSAIRVGEGVSNRIRFECIGDSLTAYANGAVLEQVTDSTYDGHQVALSGAGVLPMEVDFTNFAASWPAR
jgi:hypothetical protein